MYEQQSLLTADLDEIIDATGHNGAQPQEQAQKAPAVKYYPIDEETARRAHEMMSMRDYPAGRATNEYRASVDKAAALVERCEAATSPYYPYICCWRHEEGCLKSWKLNLESLYHCEL